MSALHVPPEQAFLACLDAFWILMVISFVAVPFALILRKAELGGSAPVEH